MGKRVELKRVGLTDDQYERLDREFREHEALGDILVSTIEELAARRAKRLKRTWDAVAVLAGVHGLRHTTLRIDWLNRQIVVLNGGQQAGEDE